MGEIVSNKDIQQLSIYIYNTIAIMISFVT